MPDDEIKKAPESTFQGTLLKDMSLNDLEKADWELGMQELEFNEALTHPKFDKLKPKPTMSPSFIKLRNEIKQEIEAKKNA